LAFRGARFYPGAVGRIEGSQKLAGRISRADEKEV
jgi:hypothetical protein